MKEKIDYSSPDEVIKHLSHVKNTIGIDYNNPFGAFKTDYRIELYYLGNMFYCLDTSVVDKKIDDFLKESEENDG